MLARRAYVTLGDSCHVVRCADDVTYLAAASLLAVASLLYLTRKSCGTSHLETQAGSRVEGTRGPSGAPRSGAKRRGKRACPSTGVSGRTLAPHAARGRERPTAMPAGRTSELRSGLRFVSTAG